ncbi:MAG TPA: hypothetical protein VK619_13105 [Pyrinomonadaceae bacterium]|nr:hypothetical protein [Pyrinomonadaceae bacterium]
MMNESSTQAAVAARHRTLIVLWGAQLASIGLFALLTILIRNGAANTGNRGNAALTLTFTALGAFVVIVSLLMKQKLVARAIEERSLQKLQTAYVVAFAMCEVGALFGLVDFFITGNPYYYLLFVLGVAGLIINFPKRNDILAAMQANRF